MANEPPSLRVATFNVLAPGNPDWARRSALIGRTLRVLRPDVLALQEVPTADGFGVVEELIGPGYQISAFQRASNGIGGALATRWPHRVVEEIDQRCTPRAQDFAWCATLIVELDAPVGRTLVAHHKPSWQFGYELERERQALTATQALERHIEPGTHAVVLGDFDATPDAASMLFWRGRRSMDGVSVCYQDAWETVQPGESGFTFSSENPLVRDGEVATAVSRRIDYVLVRAGIHGPTLRVRSCDRLLDEPVNGVWASDHYGVVAELELPSHAPGSWAE